MGGKEKMVILDAFGTLWGTLLGNDFFITLLISCQFHKEQDKKRCNKNKVREK